MMDAEAWEAFVRMIESARRGPADGMIPLCLIMVPADSAGDGQYDLRVDSLGILWPADFPMDKRVRLLKLAAEGYARPEKVTTFEGRAK